MKVLFLLPLVACLALPAQADRSLQREVERAISRGVDYFLETQNEDGSWGDPKVPGLTALALSSLLLDPSRDPQAPLATPLRRGLDYLVRCQNEDGSIFVEGYANYNTALSIMAFLASRDQNYQPAILKARRYLVNLQADERIQGETDDAWDGGVGYGSKPIPDLSNTHLALEALYYSRHLVEERPDAPRLNWEAALTFVSRCQNLPATNDQEWASDDPDQRGGFIYDPDQSKAGDYPRPGLPDGKRSYGSMTYAGLLSFLYAEVDRNDERVLAAVDWLRKNFTVEENPGMGLQGLFYYYHTMAKALHAAGIEGFETDENQQIAWREELALQLFNLQKSDGSWANTNGRWWEKDPQLVTSYALLALVQIHAGL
ncbi:MAG: cycloartenol synthase [Verrucomicrobiota bacterium]